ncbi:hypothetical protein RUND412_004324 [Rhizina undulata]
MPLDLTDREQPRRAGLSRNNPSVPWLLSTIGGASRSSVMRESSQTRYQPRTGYKATLPISSSSRSQINDRKTKGQRLTAYDSERTDSSRSGASQKGAPKGQRAERRRPVVEYSEDELTKSTAPFISGVSRGGSRNPTLSSHQTKDQIDPDVSFDHIGFYETSEKKNLDPKARVFRSTDDRSTRDSTQESDFDRETKLLLAQTKPRSTAHLVAELRNTKESSEKKMLEAWEEKRKRVKRDYSQKKNYMRPKSPITDELDSGDEEPTMLPTIPPFKNPQKLHPIPREKPQNTSPPRLRQFVDPTKKFDIARENGIGGLGGGPSKPKNLPPDSPPLEPIPEPKNFVNPFEKFKRLNSGVSNLSNDTGKIITTDDYSDHLSLAGDDVIRTASPRDSQVVGGRKRKVASYESSQIQNSQYRDTLEFTSSPQTSLAGSPSSSVNGSQLQPSNELSINEMSLDLEKSGLKENPKKGEKVRRPDEYCKLCQEPLPIGYLNEWRDMDGNLRRIKMAKWSEICCRHKKSALHKEWEEKGYPEIDWSNLKTRVIKYRCLLVGIIENNIPSPFRKVFAQQQKETGGNVAKLLKRDAQLQYPGYYGPRGSNILLHTITMDLGTKVGNAAKSDALIRRGGVAAFIQTVLVPELAVRLIMEDMKAGEETARKILEESRDIGEKLHMEEALTDIYDDDDSGWMDVNGADNERLMAERREQEYIDDDYGDERDDSFF